ncbi:flavodoxin family protein [Roseibium litorale]|uniref:Flavodoxin family protein n=1 Tax=Roseibium litorale TaxID=2803841 RepID=A0ABR9CPU7_9HYPH|nr:flavodoxin family protein [Roseibium litorale]MBD8892679.1 flavodoxin family protein [Roseibium litorale]
MAKCLIVFYSRTGHTYGVARAIATGLEGDLEQLVERRWRGYLAAGLGAVLRHKVQLKPVISDPETYDLVILGTPVWVGCLPPAMRSYIAANADKFHEIAFFCTEGGWGARNMFRQMERQCGKSPLATLEITETDLKSGGHVSKTSAFVNTVKVRCSATTEVLRDYITAETGS